MSDHWATDAGSIGVLGRTQTGKTTSSREVHAETSRVSIWLNRRGSDRVPNVAGKRVRSLEGLESGFRSNTRRYNFLSAAPEQDVVTLQEWLWEVAHRADRELPLQLVVDEAHHLAPQTNAKDEPSRDAVRKLAKEGMKRNIKLVLITQDPVALDKQTLRQTEYRLIFEMSTEAQHHVSEYGFDFEQLATTDKHTGVLHRADGEVLDGAVKARSKYAQ